MQLDFLQDDAATTTEAAVKENKPRRPQKHYSAAPSAQLTPAAEQPPGALPASLLAPFNGGASVEMLKAGDEADSLDRNIEGSIEKDPGAFKTISEVAKILDVPQHVLRFWESRFGQIRPLKLNGGRRYYRPQDIEILTTVKSLLYKQGYTIKGARKAFAGEKLAAEVQETQALETVSQAQQSKQQLLALRAELMSLRDSIKEHIACQPAG